VLALTGAASAALAAGASSPSREAGESIFRLGALGSGEPLQARSEAGVRLSGPAAACASCHRRSGLGGREGPSTIPPITGRYLFRPRGSAASMVPFVEGLRGDREPYTDATLARAIREGLDSRGKPLAVLMPRYPLGDADMDALIRHLKALDRVEVPGVTDREIHFATVVTPDADPGKRRAMLAVLEQFFAEHNARQMTPSPSIRGQHPFMAHRFWKLHLWEPTGAESTWREQLGRRLAAEPVFAVISGLGGRSWAPVHAFCEEQEVPCLFPNVEAPVDAERDYYTLYFSRGVLLEAQLMAAAIAEPGPGATPAVRQVYRAGDVGEAGARALGAALAQRGIQVTDSAVAAGEPAAVVARAARAAPAEVLVLWLRAEDLAALGEPPAGPGAVYASGLMGGLERAPLPPAWRERTRLAYPFDLPDRRRVRMDFALTWFRIRKVAIEEEQVQADTYLACGLVSEMLNHMSGTFIREYLIERLEDKIASRVVTGYYPRLSLARGQRFASKGGYLVRFAEGTGTRLVAEREWTTP
jgi:mono/diheme cytochrome c family protein